MKNFFLLATVIGLASFAVLYKKYKSTAELKVLWDDTIDIDN
jgi:hypothetical protein